jgi:cytidine deaminase
MSGLADLFDAARKAMARSHSPYSDFPVGAAIMTADGRIYAGANMEVSSYPEGWCAETSALAHFVMDGGGRITDICVTARELDECTPCGGCRQRLAEFASQNARVHLTNADGITRTVTLGELFPFGFRFGEAGT